jgi:DNA-binding IclR family transcriptional regulator
LYCTAVGKVMLAHMPMDERAKVLRHLDLKKLTPNTVGSFQELEAELHRVRKNGYACDLEEHELHIRCIAAPIWDHAGGVHASLSITAPLVRMPVSRLRQLAPLIQAAGLQISRELGYQATGTTTLSDRSPLGRSPLARSPLGRSLMGKSGASEAGLAKPVF